MTPEEAAAALNGCEYGEEGSPELFAAMKPAGLVAVFGASDDLMEFRGAIDDEFDGEATINVTPDGVLVNRCADGRKCPNWRPGRTATIRGLWDDGSGFSWRYETKIPHAKFIVKEDDDNYCEGIVFALADTVLA